MPHTSDRSSPRVLVLEDEPLILMETELVLADAGFAVQGAATVAAALSLLDDNSFDVAVLDISLPDGGAEAVANALVARRIPLLFCSGLDERPTGFEDVPLLEKPYREASLLEAIRMLVAMR